MVDEIWVKTITIFVVGMSFYLYRLSLIPNCLYRIDQKNIKRLCLGAIPEGLIGPLRSVYLAIKYKDLKTGYEVFKELFLSVDNPIIIFGSLAFIGGLML